MRARAQIAEAGANPDFEASPLEDNLFEWHFTIRGPPGTAFEGGRYHGRITLPPEYPFKPPSITLLNASGRFTVGKKICLSVSAHHPEHWQPAWGIRTIITALIAFFPTKAEGALAGLDYTDGERRKLAVESRRWQCPTCHLCMADTLPLAETDTGVATASTLPPAPAELTFAHEAPAAASGAASGASATTSQSAAPGAGTSTDAEGAGAGSSSGGAGSSSGGAGSSSGGGGNSSGGAASSSEDYSGAAAAAATEVSSRPERRPELTAPSPARAPLAAVPSALAAAARESPAAAPASAPARQRPPPATAAAPHSVDWLGLLAAALVGTIALLLSRKLMGDANDA
jgi:ubiquitin-conjugating enzyme E2 J1